MDSVNETNNQITPPTPTPVLNPTPKKNNNAVRSLISLIVLLVALLVVAMAYIKVQKAYNWGNNIQKDITVNVPATSIATGTSGTQEILPGASLVNPEKQVLNSKFEVAKNDAIPNSPEAPKSVIIKKEDLPAEALNLQIGNGKITPNTFNVKSGDLISLAVTSIDNQVHVFGFYDGAVSGIAMGVSEGQTKAINFNAPTPGTYSFGCGVPQHKEKGEVGTMIVK
jgi:plastocyanin